MVDSKELMSLAERFDELREAAIDASSIIYMLKAGFLGLLGSTITLETVPEVAAETGWPALPVKLVGPVPGDPGSATAISSKHGAFAVSDDSGSPGPDLSNDQRLLSFALTAWLPLVSEDRALLRAAEEAGLEYYNSLMMLAFLRYRGRIDEAWFEESKARLLSLARYGEDVLEAYRGIERELGL